MNPVTHPFNVISTAPEDLQVLVGVTILVLGIVGAILVGVDCAVKWWNKRNK